jgi:hypothetical protein
LRPCPPCQRSTRGRVCWRPSSTPFPPYPQHIITKCVQYLHVALNYITFKAD